MTLETAKAFIQQARKAMEDESLDFTSDLDCSMVDLISDMEYHIGQRDEVEGQVELDRKRDQGVG